MLGASGRRRARRKSQFGSCVPAQQDVQASTVAVDEAQIIRLIGRVAPRRAFSRRPSTPPAQGLQRQGPPERPRGRGAPRRGARERRQGSRGRAGPAGPPAAPQVLIAGLGGIRPLVELLGDERKSAACREAAARTLWNLATNNDLKVSIAAAGAISPLVALMGGANASVGCKEAAAGCLRNLAVTAENAAAIVSAGGLAPLVALCRVGPGWNGGDAVAAAEAAARALWNLAYDDPGNQVAIARARVRRFLGSDRKHRRRTRARSARCWTSAGSACRRAAPRPPPARCGTSRATARRTRRPSRRSAASRRSRAC